MRYFERRGVVLTTGDYSASTELKAKHVGEDAARIPPVNPASTGDGFHLGEEAGGYTLQMDRLYEGLRFAPSKRPDLIKLLPTVPALNRMVRFLVERLPKNCFRDIHGRGVDKRYRPDVDHRADTLEELADAIGVDPATLRATVDRWNQNVRDGKDADP
ncbi:fumarate reductase flavoprotein subunit [Streptomyces sp. KO7888]|uniref:FAD-binding protein n=1 Tax=Streptomyces sp. KO7888 TaxID=2602737 RepID=UPI0013F64340|nr:FAD-binding protein [Streptomyces sp. KO7888]NHI11792.1 fumarate reductase flavoprotein subunit [Streptomyces sp. KO7888]